MSKFMYASIEFALFGKVWINVYFGGFFVRIRAGAVCFSKMTSIWFMEKHGISYAFIIREGEFLLILPVLWHCIAPSPSITSE